MTRTIVMAVLALATVACGELPETTEAPAPSCDGTAAALIQTRDCWDACKAANGNMWYGVVRREPTANGGFADVCECVDRCADPHACN